MNDEAIRTWPAALDQIGRDTAQLGFTMASEPRTGAFLQALAASKPGGRLLELGTGTGIGTAWLLAGMDPASRLDTVDNDPKVVAVAKRHLGHDVRVTFHLIDGGEFLAQARPAAFDLIYADAWPGKFSHLDAALSLLKPGGIYVVDDLLPQPSWPDDHAPRVPKFIEEIEARQGYAVVKLAWSSGLLMLVRTHD